ncbi:MAG: HNH endonuclease [Clostridium sp.]
MIRLERGECPVELSDEVVQELTEKYKNDNEDDVWNSPKIKKPLKDALTRMTNSKCAYCECKLNLESKDTTIDHFLPKVSNDSLVVRWTNLLPSCLRCNRAKNRKEDEIINPCNVDPKKHLGVKKTSFRLTEINNSALGKNTIRVLKLNDIERIMIPRQIVTERIIEKLLELLEDVEDLQEIKSKHIHRLECYLSEGLKDKEYSAVVAAKVLDEDTFQKLKVMYQNKGLWNSNLQRIEQELIEVALVVKQINHS